jgi:hypothetical protein
MGRRLWDLRQRGGWIDLDFPGAAAVVFGEVRSMAEGAWGTAPANELSTMAYLVLRDECILRLLAKPLCDGVFSVLGKMAPGGFGSRRRSAATDAGDLGDHRDLGLLCNFCFI